VPIKAGKLKFHVNLKSWEGITDVSAPRRLTLDSLSYFSISLNNTIKHSRAALLSLRFNKFRIKRLASNCEPNLDREDLQYGLVERHAFGYKLSNNSQVR